MVKNGEEAHHRIDLAMQSLAINYENHTKQDEECFDEIKERLKNIEAKLDKWTVKVAGISGAMGLLSGLVVLLLGKI